MKFHDLDADGVKDSGEPGLGGWTFYADYDEDARLDAAGNDNIDGGGDTEPFGISAANGTFTISNINCPPSVCGSSQLTDIHEVEQAGWTCSFPSNCLYDEVDFASDTSLTGKDFGNWTPVTPPETPPVTPPAGTAPSASAPVKAFAVGTAQLSGPTGCAGKRFRTSVRGTSVVKAEFFLDGRKLETLSKPNSKGAYSVVVDTRKLPRGVHRLKATVSFTAASGTTPKTLKRTFQHCRATRTTPRFTG